MSGTILAVTPHQISTNLLSYIMHKKYLLLFISLFILKFSFGQYATSAICIGEEIVVKSEILSQDRNILVRLPNNYNTSNENYTVHYVLDGEITFYGYSGLVQIKSIAEQIPNAIVVGIPNIDRNFDMNPKENADNFLKFITQELIPEIDNKYRTNSKRILSGYSMAGNFVIYALINKENHFDMFLSGSPYRLDIFKTDQIDTFFENTRNSKAVFTSMGNKDREDQLKSYIEFCRYFEINKNDFIDFKYDVTPNRDHDNNFLINWQDGLDHFYRDWKPDTEN